MVLSKHQKLQITRLSHSFDIFQTLSKETQQLEEIVTPYFLEILFSQWLCQYSRFWCWFELYYCQFIICKYSYWSACIMFPCYEKRGHVCDFNDFSSACLCFDHQGMRFNLSHRQQLTELNLSLCYCLFKNLLIFWQKNNWQNHLALIHCLCLVNLFEILQRNDRAKWDYSFGRLCCILFICCARGNPGIPLE